MSTTSYITRKATNAILDAVAEGLLDRDTVILACLTYMSEDDVADMARCNELLPSDEQEDDETDETRRDGGAAVTPILKGGQSRSPASLRSDASSLLLTFAVVVAVIAALIVRECCK